MAWDKDCSRIADGRRVLSTNHLVTIRMGFEDGNQSGDMVKCLKSEAGSQGSCPNSTACGHRVLLNLSELEFLHL